MSQNVDGVKQILGWYPALTPGQRDSMIKFLFHGSLAGTGKLVILPVDQDCEHCPAASFAPNPPAYNPFYYAQLAIDAGCNGFVAPLGAMELVCELVRKNGLPTILKCNFSDMMAPKEDPFPAVTAWVDDAVRLGCEAVGFTIYPGSKYEREMYGQVRQLVADARRAGKIVVVWAYPRGSGLPRLEAITEELKAQAQKQGQDAPAIEYPTKQTDVESAIDVVAYSVRVALQLGAHIVKCKPPLPWVVLPHHRKKNVYADVPMATLAERVNHVVSQAAFAGQRIVIFSGSEAKGEDAVLKEIEQIAAGGAFGSIVGCNSFQRPHDEGVDLLKKIMDIYRAKAAA